MERETAERLAALHRELAAVYQGLAKESDLARSDSVVSLIEAATRLGVTRSWLCRAPNWRAVGGYRGADRRIHFPLSALSTYANAHKR